MSDKFTPTEDARKVFRTMYREASDAIMEKFFDLWEASGDPREAGSMAAHAYIKNAARVAVFGARCAGEDPRQHQWQACCDEQFHDAVRDVATAFIQAAIDETSPKTAE